MVKKKSKEVHVSFEKSLDELLTAIHHLAGSFQKAIPTPEAVQRVAEATVADFSGSMTKRVDLGLAELKRSVEKSFQKELADLKERVTRLEEAAPGKGAGGAGAAEPAGSEGDLKKIRVRLAVLEKKFAKAAPGGLDEAAVARIAEKAVGDSSPIVDERSMKAFLHSDEVKEFFDEKFKTFRNWLKTEEIPKIVKASLGGKGPAK